MYKDPEKQTVAEAVAPESKETKWCQPGLMVSCIFPGKTTLRIQNRGVLPSNCFDEMMAALCAGVAPKEVRIKPDGLPCYMFGRGRVLNIDDLNKQVAIISRYGFQEVKRWTCREGHYDVTHVRMESL